MKINNLIKKEVMWCLNDKDRKGILINKMLYGPDDGKPHRRIDLIYKPSMKCALGTDNLG